MKATPSKDGRMRATLRVEHRISRMTIEHALLWKYMRDLGGPDWELPKSREACIRITREALVTEGDNLWARVEDIGGVNALDPRDDTIEDEARQHVAKLFPELAGS